MASSNDAVNHRSNCDGQSLDLPIDKVPDELLALIFNHLDDRTSLPNHKPVPHIMSSVNRRWRRIAIDLSSLWSHIILSFKKFRLSPSTYVERPSLWIERSRTSPLDISIDLSHVVSAPGGSEEPLLNLVLPYIDQWRYLNVIVDHTRDINSFAIALDSAAAPLLREAVIVTRYMINRLMATLTNYHGQNTFLRGGSPSLRSVRLIGIHYSTLPLHNLTSLDLRNQTGLASPPNYEDLCNLTAASPALEHLTLHSFNLFITEDIGLAPIVIKSLKSLSIHFRSMYSYIDPRGLVIFLSLLSAPALEEMELISMTRRQIRELSDLISKRSPRLEYTNLHTFKLAISSSDNNNIERLFNSLCSSTTTFFSIRNHGFSVIPTQTEVLISDPGDSGLKLETVVESPLRLVRVPTHARETTSSEFAIEFVDSPALFKYTGEDDSDIYSSDSEEEEEEGI